MDVEDEPNPRERSTSRKSNREYQRVSTKRKIEHIGNVLSNLGICKCQGCENSFADLVKVATKIISLWQLHSVSPMFVHAANADAVNALAWFLSPDVNEVTPSVLACKGDALADLEEVRKSSQAPLVKRERNKMTKYKQFWRKRVFCRAAPVVLHRILVHLALLEANTEPILSDGDSVSHKKALQLLDTYSNVYRTEVGITDDLESSIESPVEKKPRIEELEHLEHFVQEIKTEPEIKLESESESNTFLEENASWLQCALAHPKYELPPVVVMAAVAPVQQIEGRQPESVPVVAPRRCRDPNDHDEFVNMVISGPYTGSINDIVETAPTETRAIIDNLSASMGMYNPGLDVYARAFGGASLPARFY